MLETVAAALQRDDRPIRKTVRQLRWFKQSFAAQVGEIAARTGVEFELDEKKLAAAFIDWLRLFRVHKPADPGSRRGYVGFAAGLMLRAMLTHRPLSVRRRPQPADAGDPALFWPQGYVYVMYCLNVRAAVLNQEFGEPPKTAPALSDIKTWWSFKENVREDVFLSSAFLDLFAGDQPDWSRAFPFPARRRV